MAAHRAAPHLSLRLGYGDGHFVGCGRAADFDLDWYGVAWAYTHGNLDIDLVEADELG